MNWTLDQSAQVATILGFVVAVLSLVGLAFSAYRYVQIRRIDQRQQRFENYHSLIDLALGNNENRVVFADRQAAAIFELRSYPEYREIIERILSRLHAKAVASEEKDTPPVRTVTDEITLTLSS